MKNVGKKIAPVQAEADAISPCNRTLADALKIAKALQSFAADNEAIDVANEPQLAEITQAIEEEIAAEASSKTAKSWDKRLRRYAKLEDPNEAREFFEQFTSWLSHQEQSRNKEQLLTRSSSLTKGSQKA